MQKSTSADKPNLWGSSDAYEQYMGRWGRRIAPNFLRWLAAPLEKSWIDIGCGTGGLTGLIIDQYRPEQLLGIDPSDEYIKVAREHVQNAEFTVGDALQIELPDNSVDFAVSGLVLNFLPDKTAAIDEMVRIIRPGGNVALYVWDYSGHMQIMRYFFDAARIIDASSANFDDGINAPICNPKPLTDSFIAAGLVDVETTAIDIPTAFEDFDDYWSPFLGGTGSAPKYLVSLDAGIQDRIKVAVRAKLPTAPDGKILLAARAWAVKGRKPA